MLAVSYRAEMLEEELKMQEEKVKIQLNTHSCLRIPLEKVVCIYDTFDNNFEIRNDFTRYFKGSC